MCVYSKIYNFLQAYENEVNKKRSEYSDRYYFIEISIILQFFPVTALLLQPAFLL